MGWDASKFFKDAFYYQTESTAGEFFTGDRELSPVRNATFGGKLTLITLGGDKPVWGLFDKLQVHVKADVLMLDVLAADDLANNPMGVDKQFIYGNSLIDAVILQLGVMELLTRRSWPAAPAQSSMCGNFGLWQRECYAAVMYRYGRRDAISSR